MSNLKHYILYALVLLLPMLSSCRQELCYNHFPAMNVSFTWEQEWERDYGMSHHTQWDYEHYGFGYDVLRPAMPEWIIMVKYADGYNPLEHYLSPKGGEVTIGSNTNQSFLLYNGDTQYIVLHDMASLPDARASATARSRSSIALANVMERHPDARTTSPPDALYAAFIKDVPHVANHECKHMPVNMQPLVYTYLIRFEFETGVRHIQMARGALGGMAESVYLRDGVTSEQTAIILFDCDTTSYGCEARVSSFGIPGFPDEYYGRAANDVKSRPFTLNLELLLNNNKVIEYNYDISDQMAKQPRGGVITISGLRIEDSEAGFNSGFEVNIDDWIDKEEVNLPVGNQT